MSDKALALLGFAAKAGRLSYGMKDAIEALGSRKSCLLIAASDISAKSKKELAFHAGKKDVPVLLPGDYDIKTVSDAVGRKCGILSVNDSGFAGALKGALHEKGGTGCADCSKGGNADDE